eukprot:9858888-Karenia_brevis.AAC.1
MNHHPSIIIAHRHQPSSLSSSLSLSTAIIIHCNDHHHPHHEQQQHHHQRHPSSTISIITITVLTHDQMTSSVSLRL